MAEVFKFNDLKEEGSEAAVKVIVKCRYIYFLVITCIFFFLNRQEESIDNRASFTSLKMEILSCSSSMPGLVSLLGKTPKRNKILHQPCTCSLGIFN